MIQVKTDSEPLNRAFSAEIGDSFLFQIHRIKKALFRRTNALMSEAGITLQLEQLPLIMILQHKELSQRELSDKTMRDKSSILRSINALEKKDLLIVRKDKTDRRKNVVSLTAEGISVAKNIRSLMKKSEDEVLSVFTPQERVDALDTIRSYADRLDQA
ncbi:MarR family winged helix-turn-helix transcriptional regulator [Flavobacterium aquidurense]|uniref:MarR family winged helix-turn-helix transcriptional regulator n=1 Tax=Flavobacterium aquidurense TaxID=362413 RepID=UPI002866E681|nr:MarR family winged helix-turn-helix transcriptional regulator [Flavobacterium aquidurense]MDR7370018.1 DNA-binding MarR family transcriptional regulator [Flavobacterium aquidurense]